MTKTFLIPTLTKEEIRDKLDDIIYSQSNIIPNKVIAEYIWKDVSYVRNRQDAMNINYRKEFDIPHHHIFNPT